MSTVRSRTSQHGVFATAQFADDRILGHETRRVPGSTAHAKTMGTTTTLCGLSTLTWHKFWDLAFVKVRGERCGACSAALAVSLAAGTER